MKTKQKLNQLNIFVATEAQKRLSNIKLFLNFPNTGNQALGLKICTQQLAN